MAPAPPTSPQKRLTRSRAAAKKSVEDAKSSNTQVTSKRTTRTECEAAQQKSTDADMPEGPEPLRKSARRVATAATAASTRRIKITPLNGSTNPQQPVQGEDDSSHTATRKPRATRSKRSAEDEANVEEKETVEEPVKSKRQAKSKAKDTSSITAPKPRGRPKKTEVAQNEVIAETVQAPRQTRGRSGSTAIDTRALAVAPSRTTALKKKVTFQDLPESDKENQPILKAKTTTKTKSATPANGIRAKPVRRPATPKANPRQKVANSATEVTNQGVLTPKKVTQVAKSSSPTDSDEDELNGAKTPIRDLSQSPKRNVTASPVKKLDFAATTLASSPLKSQPGPTLSSPARRPAPSPFKDALKDSPKRGDFFPKISQFQKSSETERAGQMVSSSSSTLLQSPKRVAFGNPSFSQSSSKSRTSPSKASLLQSPPKRPASPEKPPTGLKPNIHPATPVSEVDAGMMSPDVTVSSHFKAIQSPQRSSRVHRVSSGVFAEEVKSVIDFDESVVGIRSPLKMEDKNVIVFEEVEEGPHNLQVVDKELEDHCRRRQLEAHSGIQEEDITLTEEVPPPQLMEDVEVRTTAPTDIMLRNETPVNPAAFLFRSTRFRDDDESSEDELQSPVKFLQAKTPATSKGSEFRPSITGRAAFSEKPGFTPLATQLSGWLASSPDKQPMKKYQQRGIFSPLARQHVPGEVIIDRQSPATSRVSMEPRYSAAQRQSLGSRKSLGLRSSLAVSVDGTPEKSTYFADEMAVKDLETEIQNMQADSLEQDELQDANDPEVIEDVQAEQCAPDEICQEVEVIQAQGEDGRYQPEEQNMEPIMQSPSDKASRDLSTEFDAEAVCEQAEVRPEMPNTSQDSTASSVYDDKNADPTMPAAISEQGPAKVQMISTTAALVTSPSRPLHNFTTPSRQQPAISRFASTVVSKVPLRAEGHVSPIKVPKKRSRSLSDSPSSVKKTPVFHASGFPRSITISTFSPAQSEIGTPFSTAITPGQQSFAIDDFGESTLDAIDIDEDDENLPPVTPSGAVTISSLAASPSKIPKPQGPAPSAVLQGAVVFVDVHTTEGADASGIFIELLTQMGARCVKNWSWNPRAGMAGAADVGDSSSIVTPGGGKIGITHVVYKDGGKRTLEKVRDTERVVRCVGVGWVLE